MAAITYKRQKRPLTEYLTPTSNGKETTDDEVFSTPSDNPAKILRRPSDSKTGISMPKKITSKQLFLDFGQKNFGHRTCPECGMLYSPGIEVCAEKKLFS